VRRTAAGRERQCMRQASAPAGRAAISANTRTRPLFLMYRFQPMSYSASRPCRFVRPGLESSQKAPAICGRCVFGEAAAAGGVDVAAEGKRRGGQAGSFLMWCFSSPAHLLQARKAGQGLEPAVVGECEPGAERLDALQALELPQRAGVQHLDRAAHLLRAGITRVARTRTCREQGCGGGQKRRRAAKRAAAAAARALRLETIDRSYRPWPSRMPVEERGFAGEGLHCRGEAAVVGARDSRGGGGGGGGGGDAAAVDLTSAQRACAERTRRAVHGQGAADGAQRAQCAVHHAVQASIIPQHEAAGDEGHLLEARRVVVQSAVLNCAVCVCVRTKCVRAKWGEK